MAFDPSMFFPIEPVQLFDDYYFVGNKLCGFHILKTSEGLVLFEAMDKPSADAEFLVPGLEKLGLGKEKILILFLTHGHFDHYGAAEAVRQRTGCKVALSLEDTAYISWSDESIGPEAKPNQRPKITQLVKDGDEFTFGGHTVYVMGAPGHTPGCLNYSFTVHDHGEPHRVMMVGGYGVFGPGNYPHDYPYGVQYAVDHALEFASTCVKTWEYCKKYNCDIYLNPHPHLCDMLEHVQENQNRKEGGPNALVIGVEGVRKWLEDLFDRCMDLAVKFTDIKTEYHAEN